MADNREKPVDDTSDKKESKVNLDLEDKTLMEADSQKIVEKTNGNGEHSISVPKNGSDNISLNVGKSADDNSNLDDKANNEEIVPSKKVKLEDENITLLKQGQNGNENESSVIAIAIKTTESDGIAMQSVIQKPRYDSLAHLKSDVNKMSELGHVPAVNVISAQEQARRLMPPPSTSGSGEFYSNASANGHADTGHIVAPPPKIPGFSVSVLTPEQNESLNAALNAATQRFGVAETTHEKAVQSDPVFSPAKQKSLESQIRELNSIRSSVIVSPASALSRGITGTQQRSAQHTVGIQTSVIRRSGSANITEGTSTDVCNQCSILIGQVNYYRNLLEEKDRELLYYKEKASPDSVSEQ